MAIDIRLEESKELSPMLATVVERQTADIVRTSTNETVITAIKILIVKPLIAYFYRRS
jgi:hypothetical protein